MFKKFICSSIVFLLCVHLYCQVGEQRSAFSVGLNGGMTMNTMNFSPTIKQRQKKGAMFGINCRYISEKYFSTICGLEIELNYANLGWEERIEDGSGNTYSHSIQYVQLPLLMQLGWGKESNGLKFIFEAGPQLGFSLGTSEKLGGGTWDTSHRPNNVVYQYDHDIDHSFDYGILGGMGVEWSFGRNHLLLHGRYYFGLGDTYDHSKQGYFSRSANQTIEVKLTYLKDISFPKLFKKKKKEVKIEK